MNCPTEGIVRTAAQGQTSTVVFWPEPTATDNSGGQVSQVSNRSPGQTFALGTVEVRYTFTDPSGNEARCTFTVTVRGENFCHYLNGIQEVMVTCSEHRKETLE